jgi:hypothetical protein
LSFSFRLFRKKTSGFAYEIFDAFPVGFTSSFLFAVPDDFKAYGVLSTKRESFYFVPKQGASPCDIAVIEPCHAGVFFHLQVGQVAAVVDGSWVVWSIGNGAKRVFGDDVMSLHVKAG